MHCIISCARYPNTGTENTDGGAAFRNAKLLTEELRFNTELKMYTAKVYSPEQAIFVREAAKMVCEADEVSAAASASRACLACLPRVPERMLSRAAVSRARCARVPCARCAGTFSRSTCFAFCAYVSRKARAAGGLMK